MSYEIINDYLQIVFSLNYSKLPVCNSLTIFAKGALLKEVKPPPTIIFPLLCIAIAFTLPDPPASPPRLKVVLSIAPLNCILAILLLENPFIDIKLPPINIFPSFWIYIVFTEEPGPVPFALANEASLVPSLLILAILTFVFESY